MYDHTRCRKWNICDGDDEVRIAHAVLAAAVGHVVDPLFLILLIDKPLVLTRVPVVSTWVVILATVQAFDDPPFSFNLGTEQIFRR